jgi:hypothetical protein
VEFAVGFENIFVMGSEMAGEAMAERVMKRPKERLHAGIDLAERPFRSCERNDFKRNRATTFFP